MRVFFGIAKGIEFARGKFLEKMEIAKSMLAAGLDMKTVVKITGLTEAQILS